MSEDESDDEVQEEEQEQEQKDESSDDDHPNDQGKIKMDMRRKVLPKRMYQSNEKKRWGELRTEIENMLDEFVQQDYKASYKSFQALQKKYQKAKKIIDENGHPNFFIVGMHQLVKDMAADNADKKSDLRRFAQDLKLFTVPFNNLLNEYEEDPEKFADEEVEDGDEEEERGDGKSSDDDSDDSDGSGGWFVDDAEVAVVDNKQENDNQPKKPKRRETRKKPLYETFNTEIDDTVARTEVDKFALSRGKGKIIASVARLKQLFGAVLDEGLAREIRLEIMHTVTEGNQDRPVPVDDWELVMSLIPEMNNDPALVIPLFERLDRDFWARSIDPRHLFTPDVTKLHNLLPKFMGIVKGYTNDMKKQNNDAFYVRSELIILNHEYTQASVDVQPLVVSILKVLSEKPIFEESWTVGTKMKCALLLATNLAIRDKPYAAFEIMSRLPEISEHFQIERVLYNRAKASIGLTALKLGFYELAYKSLSEFNEVDGTKAALAQREHNIYPPWMTFDARGLTSCSLLVATMLDFPSLVTGILDENGIIKSRQHKDLLRLTAPRHPEDLRQRVGVCIAMTKNGEWKKASEAIRIELSKFVPNPDRFENDLRLMSLCCFLMSANKYYGSISVQFLADKFEISVADVSAIVKGMMSGKSPIDGINAELDVQITPDGAFMLFTTPGVESTLHASEKEVRTKTARVAELVAQLVRNQ